MTFPVKVKICPIVKNIDVPQLMSSGDLGMRLQDAFAVN
jgi:hypothetical protein